MLKFSIIFSFLITLCNTQLNNNNNNNTNNSITNCSQNINFLLSSFKNNRTEEKTEILLRYDILIFLPQKIHFISDLGYLINFTTGNISTINFITTQYSLNESKVMELLDTKLLGLGPSLVMFPCINSDEEYNQILNQVITYYEKDFKWRNWHPIFVIIHPNLQIPSQDNLILNAARNFSVSSDVYILYQISSSHSPTSISTASWTLMEYYSIRSQLFQHNLTHFINSEGISFYDLITNKTQRRSNFNNATVIAIGIDDPDYPLATKFKAGTSELETGFEVWMYRYLRDALNFSEAAIFSNGYLREGKDGHLTGFAPQLISQDGDVAIGSTEMLEWRMKGPDGITYVSPMFYANIYAYFKQPPSSSVRNIFTQTFTTGLWVAAFLLWIFIVFVLKVTVKIKTKRKDSSVEDKLVAQDGILWAASVICQQGWHTSPTSASTRITFFFGIFSGLILYVAYSAALVSILSVEVKPIQSFPDLLREKFYIVSDSHIPTAKSVVKGLEETKQIPKLMENVRNVEIADNLDQLIRNKYALVTIPDSFYPILQQLNYSEDYVCNTVSFEVVSLRPLKSSCSVRRGSPLREYLNYKMIQLHERGIRERRVAEYMRATTIQCLENSHIFHTDLGLRDVFTAFVLILLGTVLSLIIVLGEKYHKKKKAENPPVTLKQ